MDGVVVLDRMVGQDEEVVWDRTGRDEAVVLRLIVVQVTEEGEYVELDRVVDYCCDKDEDTDLDRVIVYYSLMGWDEVDCYDWIDLCSLIDWID